MATYVRLFGTPAVKHGGGTIALRPERRHQLAAWLALRATPVARDQLAALFWPDRDNAAARRNLRRLAFDVEGFDWTAGFTGDRATLGWSVATDVADFERALAGGRLDDALALYRGPLCEGLDDAHNNALAEALRFERARLADRWRTAMFAALDRATDASGQLTLAQKLLAADALDEEALAAALRALAQLGRTGEAQRLYRDLKERLAETLGIEPSAWLRELVRGLDAGREPTPAAAARSADFVGRAAELAELQALAARDACRLLTITGPGGIGKSRLAKAALPQPSARRAGVEPRERHRSCGRRPLLAGAAQRRHRVGLGCEQRGATRRRHDGQSHVARSGERTGGGDRDCGRQRACARAARRRRGGRLGRERRRPARRRHDDRSLRAGAGARLQPRVFDCGGGQQLDRDGRGTDGLGIERQRSTRRGQPVAGISRECRADSVVARRRLHVRRRRQPLACAA
jgi:DNA-binding SARP family transcriptional activator